MSICANCVEGNLLRRLRVAYEIQCIIYLTLHDNNVTQVIVKLAVVTKASSVH